MRIAILGYWSDDKQGEWKLLGSQREFVQACEELGAELGLLQQTVIVSNDSEKAADYHVVKGVVAHTPADCSERLIRVIRPQHGGNAFRSLRESRPTLFDSPARVLHRKEGAKFIPAQEADAVITIAGAETTFHLGMASLLAKKTLVPIASFGGASRLLLDALDEHRWPAQRQELGSLSGPWSRDVLETAIRLTGATRPTRLLLIHGRTQDCSVLKRWLSEHAPSTDVSIMVDETEPGRTLPEKFEDLAGRVDAAIAIATPDDVGGLNEGDELDLQPRARQNIWLEVGWFWGHLGRDRIVVLRKGDLEMPSELEGLELYSYRETPNERGSEILAFLAAIRSGELKRH